MGPCCKVGQVVEKYELAVDNDTADVHEYLVARWTGTDGYTQTGVRTLADWFNEKLLRTVYFRHGRAVTDIRITSEYEVLSDGDEIERAEVVDDLATDGIDGEAVADDFVSRSTMRRHLVNCRDAQKESADESTSEWERDRIAYSTEQFRDNIGEAVQSLANKGDLPGGDGADIDVAVFLSCPECSREVRLQTALDRQYICQEHLAPPDSTC